VTVPHLENYKVFGEKTYHVDVEGKLINAFEIGQTVDIIGIVKTRSSSKRPKMQKFSIAALNIEPRQKIDLSKDLQVNTQFRVLSALHHDLENAESELAVRNRIVSSVFPKIFGSNAIKLSILLVVCSGSGKTEKDDDSKRDVFHLMLAGRNSAGKRTLLRAAAELTPKSNEVHSFGVTLSSLTARSFKLKKGGDNNIEAGVLLRANDAISCFHDFDCLKKKYRRVLHEIMETQRVKIASGEKYFIKFKNFESFQKS
jgi:DNA replicative helicase MCM subunit Mcm2 (Cdc46/Mcm family)